MIREGILGNRAAEGVMPRRKSRTLTEVELEFMHVLWSSGESTTEDVQDALCEEGHGLADGSVRKVLSILVEKGYVTRRRAGRGFLYKAQVARRAANRSLVRDLLDRAFGGSASLMVASLLDGRRVKPKEMAAIKRLIARREREGGK
jgi:predicted transcriptional regulator